ncbi:MAG: circularly permuted type 2 ATP-grasp protein [Spirochaetales bacterium]|nr:circularly permuted type 2 ATP-grasp protein [Spirochaetales bacterium]
MNATRTSLTADYRPGAVDFDELLDQKGELRPAYRFLIETLEALPSGAFEQRKQVLGEILHEQGVSYNVYDQKLVSPRPWSLDLLPLVFSSKEWQALERGLIQRAELFSHIFKDLYGKQELLHKKILPPAIILGHDAYLRPMAGWPENDSFPLVFHSADLVRQKRGQFMVYYDRTNAPSGSGYALENRLAISRLFPSLYRDSQVHRIASYFRALRSSLVRHSPAALEPTIVFLTPGAGNETYFEHSFLSTYLGYELVQGQDLVVNNATCYLKTFDGLRKVDVILRRVDDSYCDPLELRGDSLLGVPGLLQAIREKNVFVANPPGSGVLENPGLYPFLGDACRYFFGEELHLPNIPTVWLGSPAVAQEILEELNNYVILPIAAGPDGGTLFPARMTESEQDDLRLRIRRQPAYYVAQPAFGLTTCPVLKNGRLAAGKYVLRTFSVNTRESFAVMPGGLARVSTDLSNPEISNQAGAFSKDVWVLLSEPEPEQPVETVSRGTIQKTDRVPSRTAENLFWLGRYLERSENNARLIRKAQQLTFESNQKESSLWLCLVTDVMETYPAFETVTDHSLDSMQTEILRLTADEHCLGSLAFNISALLTASRNCLDRLSEDSIRIVNSLERKFIQNQSEGILQEYLDEVILSFTALAGNFSESMSQNAGWTLLHTGRRAERATLLIRLARAVVRQLKQPSEGLLEALLEVHNIKNTYKRRYRGAITLHTLIDLVIFDERNPRSLAYQLLELQKLATGLPQAISDRLTTRQYLTRLLARYQLLITTENYRQGFPDFESVLPWMEEVHAELRNMGDALAGEFFTHVALQTRLDSFQEDGET